MMKSRSYLVATVYTDFVASIIGTWWGLILAKLYEKL